MKRYVLCPPLRVLGALRGKKDIHHPLTQLLELTTFNSNYFIHHPSHSTTRTNNFQLELIHPPSTAGGATVSGFGQNVLTIGIIMKVFCRGDLL
jgi:hypothetical protein